MTQAVVKPIAWSHSRIKTWMECGEKLYHEAIAPKAERVPYEQGPAQLEGERIHKALEKRLTHKLPLEGKDAKFERLIQVVEAMPGLKYGERDLCLNTQLQPTGYFADDAWVRVTIDATVLNGDYGWLFDWKNGKVTIDEEQLMLYAAVGFQTFTQINTFDTKYVWLQHGIANGRTYTRTQLPQMWEQLLKKPMALQRAAAENFWPPKPGRHCAYCTVNKYGKCSQPGEKYKERG